MTGRKTRILLADAQALVRRGLRLILLAVWTGACHTCKHTFHDTA